MAVDNIARGMAASALKNQGGGGVFKASELDNDVPFVSASDSQTLTEDQQKQAQENIGLGGLVVSEGGDTLTWDGNTEGKTPFQGCYKVSDVIFTSADLIAGSTIAITAGAEVRVFGISGMQVMQNSDVCMVMQEGTFYIMSIGPEMATGASIEEGTYFGLLDIDIGVGYISSLTIPGYTGFVKKQVNLEYIPDMYYEEVVENVIVENATLNVTQSGPLGFSSMNEFALDEIKDGVTYTVVWDGTSYECVAHPCTGMAPPIAGTYNAIGNGSIINSSDVDSGEPFVILVAGGGAVFVLSKTSGTYTLSLTCPETVVHKIPTKYLPANNFTITMSMGAGPGSWSIDKTVEDITKAISKGDVVYIDATVAGAGVVSLTSISTDGAFIFSTFEIGTSIIFFYDVHISTTGQVTFRTYSLNKTQ